MFLATFALWNREGSLCLAELVEFLNVPALMAPCLLLVVAKVAAAATAGRDSI